MPVDKRMFWCDNNNTERTNVRKKRDAWMDEMQRERLLAGLHVWERLQNVNLRIMSGTKVLQGRYKRFSGKRQIRIYLDHRQSYSFHTDAIKRIEFCKVQGLRYTLYMEDRFGVKTYIEHISEDEIQKNK